MFFDVAFAHLQLYMGFYCVKNTVTLKHMPATTMTIKFVRKKKSKRKSNNNNTTTNAKTEDV